MTQPRSAADQVAREYTEADQEIGRPSEAARARRGRVSSAADDSFDTRAGDASAPDADPAGRAAGAAENPDAAAEYRAVVRETELKRPRLQLAPTASAPRLKHRAVADVTAPEVRQRREECGADQHRSFAGNHREAEVGAERDVQIGGAAPRDTGGRRPRARGRARRGGDASLRQLIALSATPAPPAPEVSVPEGNLAARISISPEGGNRAHPGGAEHGGSAAGERWRRAATAGVAEGNRRNRRKFPTRSCERQRGNAARGHGGGGITPSGRRAGGLILKPLTPYEPCERHAPGTRRREPLSIRACRPKKFFRAKRYTRCTSICRT